MRHASGSRGRYDVTQHRTSRSPPPQGLHDVHRFDLPLIGRETFQGADPDDRLIGPNCPKADIGALQPSEVQSVRTAGSGLCTSIGQMSMQKIDHARVTEAALDNMHHG